MPAPSCPNCYSGETLFSDFGQTHCRACGLYWHYWLDEASIQGEIREHKEAKERLKKKAAEGLAS